MFGTAGHALRAALTVFALTAAVACSSTEQATVDHGQVRSVVHEAAPWAETFDASCAVGTTDATPRAVMDLVEHPPRARDFDTAVDLALAIANCTGSEVLAASYADSLDLEVGWIDCARRMIDGSTAAQALAAALVDAEPRSIRDLEPLIDCVVRSDPDIAVDVVLPGLLVTTGLAPLQPVAGPTCVRQHLSRSGLSGDRIVALLLREAPTSVEIDALAGALFDCADPDRVADLFGVTVATDLDPSCVVGTGRSPAVRILVASLVGEPRPEIDIDALTDACRRR